MTRNDSYVAQCSDGIEEMHVIGMKGGEHM